MILLKYLPRVAVDSVMIECDFRLSEWLVTHEYLLAFAN